MAKAPSMTTTSSRNFTTDEELERYVVAILMTLLRIHLGRDPREDEVGEAIGHMRRFYRALEPQRRGRDRSVTGLVNPGVG